MEDTSTLGRKTMINELIYGRECTKELQNLLHRRDTDVDHGEPVSAEDLVTNIVGSFSNSLSTLSSPATTSVGAAMAEKDRRGCYKRRKTEDSTAIIASSYEDGYAWRKYGEKVILNAKFPRCYYRCTYKDTGCVASKHVQKLENGTNMFHITYFGSHSCQNINKNTQLFPIPEDLNFSLLNFEDTRIDHSTSSSSTFTNIHKGKGYGVEESQDMIDFNNHMGEMKMRWRVNQDGEGGFVGSAYRPGEETMKKMETVEARSGKVANEYHSAQIGMEHTEWDLKEHFVYPSTPSFNQVDVTNDKSGDYPASSSYGTSSNYVLEDMILNFEPSSYDDIFKHDTYMNDFSFF